MAWLLKETERSHVTDRDGSHCICRDFTVIALCFKLDLHSSRSLYSSSLKVLNGSTPRSMDAQPSLYSSSLQWINAQVNGRTALALQFNNAKEEHRSLAMAGRFRYPTTTDTNRKRSDHKFTRSILIGRRASYA